MNKFIIGLLALAGLAFRAGVRSAQRVRVFACEPEWGALVHRTRPAIQVDVDVGDERPCRIVHQIDAKPSLIAKRARSADLVVVHRRRTRRWAGCRNCYASRAAIRKISVGKAGIFRGAAEQMPMTLEKPTRPGPRRRRCASGRQPAFPDSIRAPRADASPKPLDDAPGSSSIADECGRTYTKRLARRPSARAGSPPRSRSAGKPRPRRCKASRRSWCSTYQTGSRT